MVHIESAETYTNLRTLKVCSTCSDCRVPIKPISQQAFGKYVDLRVLDLSSADLQILPESVGGLIHLRYLGLSDTKIKTIPKAVCGLINLETVELKRCLDLEYLPEEIDKLVYLRHIDLHVEWESINDSTVVSVPQGISKLSHLQTLSRFNVTSSANGLQCNISALKDLNLRGDLCILNLEGVPISKPEDARMANLQGKRLIEKILLRWSDEASSDIEQERHSRRVIEYLKPHDSIRSLWVINYPSLTFPDWMGAVSFGVLQTIRISRSQNFDFLPLLGKLPQLVVLQIDNIRSDRMGRMVGFPSLEHLIISNLTILKLSLDSEIPSLKKVSLSDCCSLMEVAIHVMSRAEITRRNCPK